MGSPGWLCRTQLVRARMRVNLVTVTRKTRRRFQGCWVFFFFALIRSSQTWSSHCGPVPLFFFFMASGLGKR